MSTLRKLMGKQHTNMRDQRKAALSFYKKLSLAPGPAGNLAAKFYEGLRRIHVDPTLNAFEKEREFKRLIKVVEAE